MQRGGLARSGRPANQEQAIRLRHNAVEIVQRERIKTELVQRNRFRARQHAHHHVFQAIRGGDDRNPQLDFCRAKLLKIYLSILRFAPLGNIQLGHDLDARDQGAAEICRDIKIVNQDAVLAKSNTCAFLARVGFDMDIRRALFVGIKDHFIHQPDQGIVGLRHGQIFDVQRGILFGEPGGQLIHPDTPAARPVITVDHK